MSAADTIIDLKIHVLYSDHHGWLVGWLHRKLGCIHNANDLAHDTFLRVLAARTATTGLRAPRAYLCTIAHGLMVDHLRRRDLERAVLEALAALPQAQVPSAETRAVWLETLIEIERMLDGLPPRVRRAFLLAQLEGQSYAQIGDQLGVSTGSVKLYLRQALVHCARCLN